MWLTCGCFPLGLKTMCRFSPLAVREPPSNESHLTVYHLPHPPQSMEVLKQSFSLLIPTISQGLHFGDIWILCDVYGMGCVQIHVRDCFDCRALTDSPSSSLHHQHSTPRRQGRKPQLTLPTGQWPPGPALLAEYGNTDMYTSSFVHQKIVAVKGLPFPFTSLTFDLEMCCNSTTIFPAKLLTA